MASAGGEKFISTNSQSESIAARGESRESSVEKKVIRDREEKLKITRERQNEERQKKIEELKAQAEAAQRYREQKEEERRRRIEEIRHRDTEKRQQVEERKKAIIEAEKERREYILKKNQERESRLGTKKRERSSIGFAFGSSTPRLLEPADFGTVSPSNFWGHRRSTSITNVAGASLSRRSSERELNDSGSKKRATSASGADRHEDHRRKSSSMYEVFNWGYSNDEPPKRFSLSIVGSEINIDEDPTIVSSTSHRQYVNHFSTNVATTTPTTTTSITTTSHEDNVDTSQYVFRSVARRKTDLMPTIPSPRDVHYGSRSSLSNTPRTPGSRSGEVTPGGSINTSRPGSAMSTSTTMSTSGYVHRRMAPPLRKQRPASIAGTGVSLEEINKHKKENKPPIKTTNGSISSNGQTTPRRMSSNVMATSTSSSRVSSLERKGSIKKDSSQTKVNHQSKTITKAPSSEKVKDKSKEMSETMNKSTIAFEEAPNAKTKDEKNALNTVKTEEIAERETIPSDPKDVQSPKADEPPIVDERKDISEEKTDMGNEKDSATVVNAKMTTSSDGLMDKNENNENSTVREPSSDRQIENEMTASMIAKSKITTEEEAKAALAERRRLAREEAERQAELERQRIEAERIAELKRQEEEAEKQRKFEEEALRLAELQRKVEEERLRQAIEEARKREEEERQKREEEEKQKLEREEAEKKAKEEAEKQRIEVAERLKREEKEREERRKRVEAIMSRTRRAGSTNTPNSTPIKDNENSKQTDATNLGAKTPQAASSDESISVGSRSSLEATTPNSTPATTPAKVTEKKFPSSLLGGGDEPLNSQAMYEQSVIDKETSLIKSFSTMVIDENAKNLHSLHQPQQQQFGGGEVTNGKMVEFPEIIHNSVANGNGHIDNVNNKNDINNRQNVVAPQTNQLIDINLESQDINNAVNFNNNSLLATTNALVNADSHENKDLSLL